MRERYWLGLTAVPFVVAVMMPGSVWGLMSGGDELTRFQDHDIVESSALVVVDGLLVTSNDSGDTGRLFSVDPRSGETVAVTHWSEDPVDVEALAPAGHGAVWVGDIGDNNASRDSVTVAKVPLENGDVDPATYELVYPDGPRDAETLVADPATGRLYVASKGVFGGVLYAAPRRLSPDRPNRLEEVGPVLPIATDGAFFPDGRHLIVRNYTEAAVYSWPDLTEVGRFGLPREQQGEGIAVAADETVYVCSEGLHAPVLTIALPPAIVRALAPAPASSPTVSPSPSAAPATTADRGDGQPEEIVGRHTMTWGWVVGGVVGVALIVVLVRSLRPH